MIRLISIVYKLIISGLLTCFTAVFIMGCGSSVPSDFQYQTVKAPEKQIFTIGQVPSRSTIELLDEREKFIEELSLLLEKDVQIRFAKEYDEIISGMETEEYDLVFLGPLSYVKAVDQLNAPYTPIVRPVRFGQPFYHSIIFTYRGSGINSLEDLRKKTFAFVDRQSTSGYLFPKASLIQSGIYPDKDFATHSFLGGHDKVVTAVNNRVYEAGAAYEGARRNTVGPDAENTLPLLHKTPPVPSEPTVIRSNLDKKLKEKITDYFLKIHDNNPTVMKSLGQNIEKYVPAEDADYDDVRSVVKTLQNEKETL